MTPSNRHAGSALAPALVALLGGLMWMGCAGSMPEPLSLPPQTVSQAQPVDEPPDAELPVAAAIKDDTVIVIEEGEPADSPSSLADAADAERIRRQTEKQSQTVITDENLQEYSSGKLTFSDRSPADDELEVADAKTAELLKTETYWRDRARDARRRWRDAHDRIPELEAEISGLRRRFYAEDDPFYRDSQIKPAWDRSLLDLDVAKEEVVVAQQDLATVMDEGRRAGALPGWLREGLELEPDLDTEREAERSGAEAREPITIDDYATEPPQ